MQMTPCPAGRLVSCCPHQKLILLRDVFEVPGAVGTGKRLITIVEIAVARSLEQTSSRRFMIERIDQSSCLQGADLVNLGLRPLHRLIGQFFAVGMLLRRPG